MTSPKIDELAGKILSGLQNHELTEDVAYEFTVEGIRLVFGDSDDFRAGALKDLTDFLNSLRVSKGYRQYDAQMIFELGRLYAVTDLLKLSSEEHELAKEIKEDARKYAMKQGIFEQIADNPGITCKELSRRNRMTEHELFLFCEDMQCKNFILKLKTGKTESYYISSAGRKLLAEMKKLLQNT